MRIRINGEDKEVPENLFVTGLLEFLGMAGDRIAIERNLDILPRANWKTTNVVAGDSYEIVHFVGGG
jgi:sulfur carrier protein